MSTMPDPEFHGRLVAIETRQADDRRELQRVRDKVHELVGAVSAISLLTAELGRIREDVALVRSEVPAVARRAAEEAIDVALERRNELNADRRREWREGFGLKAQLVSVLVGAAGFAYFLLDRVAAL